MDLGRRARRLAGSRRDEWAARVNRVERRSSARVRGARLRDDERFACPRLEGARVGRRRPADHLEDALEVADRGVVALLLEEELALGEEALHVHALLLLARGALLGEGLDRPLEVARPVRVGDVDAIEEPPRLLVLGVELRRALEVESGLLVAERVEARARRAHVARGERPVLVAEELL